jgi:hypothetical protein
MACTRPLQAAGEFPSGKLLLRLPHDQGISSSKLACRAVDRCSVSP